MPSVYELKPKFQSLLRPLTNWLAKIGVTANQVTVSAMVLSIFVGLLLFVGHPSWYWLVPGTMLVRMAMNAIDGMLAREHNMTTDLGAILNELGDVVSDIFLYLPFAYLPGFPGPLVVTVIFLALLTELVGIMGTQVGSERRYDGPMGKSDRAVAFSVLAMVIACGFHSQLLNYTLFLGLVFLLLLTIKNRVTQALKAENKIHKV